MGVSFVKYQGLGNDFVVVDELLGNHEPRLSESVRTWLCHRHVGVGADGVLTVLSPRPTARAAVARMHITNPDGSVPQMCGNGLRCVALFLAQTGRINVDEDVAIDTDAGEKTVRVHPGLHEVTVDMGPASFVAPTQFPRPLARAAVRGFPRATTVSMGNPHVVLESSSLPDVDAATRDGRGLELDASLFPGRTNVEWAVVQPDGSIDVVVWERGAGLTQACGTGACAVVAASARNGLIGFGTTRVRLPGGPLDITLRSLEEAVWMRGPVARVFSGQTAELG